MDGPTHLRTRVSLGWGLLLLVGILLGPGRGLRAQPSPRITVRVLADSVKIGERFTLTLVAEHAGKGEVLFPSADARSAVFGDVSVLQRGEVRGRSAPEGRRVDSVAYEVAAFAVDSVHVPVLPVRLVEGGDTTLVGSSPQIVSVVSVVGPDAQGLRTPAALASFSRSTWGWILLGLFAAVLLGGLAYVWWRRQDGDDSSASIERDTRSPYEVASERLEQLERRNPTDRHSCKAFYVDLTQALRVYLARRIGIRALEYTTPEVVAALRRQPRVSDTATQRMQSVLEQADLVKFADARPEPEDSFAVLEKARTVLDAIEAAQRRAEYQAPSDEAPTPA